jgi:hypothetical protein
LNFWLKLDFTGDLCSHFHLFSFRSSVSSKNLHGPRFEHSLAF